MAVHIGQKDITRFTCGSCYQLAEAIRDVTGWPIYAFWDEHFQDYDIHAFVKTPRGTYLDIYGEHSRYKMLSRWGERHIRRVRKTADLRSWDFGNPFYDSYPRARQIAPLLIADYHNRATTSAGIGERISA
jgi:hypothetical protein